MDSYDIMKARKALYAPRAGAFEVVDVPEIAYLMIDGHGDPNTAPAYTDAVETLYSASYAIRAVAKARLERVHTVGPLEGLWSAENLDVFVSRDKGAWDWTMMIAQPDWITPEIAAEGMASAKRVRALDQLRFERLAEGLSVQILHVGSYDDEGPTLARLHNEYLPANALVPTGRHHEIYLSDPRKTDPSRLRTILRQPVRDSVEGQIEVP